MIETERLKQKILDKIARSYFKHRDYAGGWERIRNFKQLQEHNSTIANRTETVVEITLREINRKKR